MQPRTPNPETLEHPTWHCSVKETDWAAEIELFRKGVAEDGQGAGQAVREGLGSLELPRPGSLGPLDLPGAAAAALPAGLGAGLEGLGDHFSAGVEGAQVQARLNQVRAGRMARSAWVGKAGNHEGGRPWVYLSTADSTLLSQVAPAEALSSTPRSSMCA